MIFIERAVMEFEIRYAVLDPNLIFNECGPSSAGPPGWTEQRIKKREAAAERYIASMNKRSGFYDKLEASILKDGFRNPISVRCGWCPDKKNIKLPIEMQEDSKKILICDSHGGSRLWMAQKHNLKIPCMIVDFIGRFTNELLVAKTQEAVLKFYKDTPRRIKINEQGIAIYDLPMIHLEKS